MKDSMHTYYKQAQKIFCEIISDPDNVQAFAVAGREIAKRVADDRLVYLAGLGGHSNMCLEECLCRAGMIVQLNPMIGATNLLYGTTKTRFLQRSSGYAKGLLEEYGVQEGDVLVLVNAYGINLASIDMALESRSQGIFTIGISSRSFGRQLEKGHPARHPNRKNMEDVCDILIDCKMPFGDATIDIPGTDQKVGPTSTLCNIFTINLLMLQSVEELLEIGCKPKVWRSINLPGGDVFNQKYFEEYGQRIRHLL